jgi:hypothetical protein
MTIRAWLPALLALPIFAIVLVAHGFVPGMLNDLPTGFLTEGSMQCLHDLGLDALTTWCHAYGEPLGFPLLTGGPVVTLGAALMYLPGVGSSEAYLLAGACFDALALAGGYGLMRKLGSSKVVALSAAALYLVAPTVIGMQQFGGTFTGFALLPAYAFVDLVMIDAVRRRVGRGIALAIAGYAAVKTGSLFLDGYSFVAGNLVSALLWATWLLRPDVARRAKTIGVAAFAAANVVALDAYLVYVPGTYAQDSLAIFRSMGLDLVTLVSPTEFVWPAAALNLTVDHQDLWGDGTNSAYNYAGFACIVLAIAYLAGRPRDRSAVAIGVAGLVALVLSLGPSVKVDETRPALAGPPSDESYLMPEELAADLPWGGLYTVIPGVDSMRATYRWFGVTRLALIVLAGLAVARLVRRPGRGRVVAVVLAGVAVVEIAPNLPLLTSHYREHRQDMREFQAAVAGDLHAATRRGERAFFLSSDGSHNDYLVNYMSPMAGLRTFNAGVDKNGALSAERWPAEIQAMASPGVTADDVAAALETGAAEVVIAPKFHLRWSSYAWPATAQQRAEAKEAFAPITADRRFRVDRYHWFSTIRSAG